MHSANVPLAAGITTVDQKCFENIISYNICSAKAFADSVRGFQAAQQRERNNPLLHAGLFASWRAEVTPWL